MISLKDRVTSKVVEAGGKLTVKSALNPVLWLCAIITIPSLGFIQFYKDPPTWIIIIALLPVCTATLGFLFLLFFDRDKLQSEDYQIKKLSLELIEQKDDKHPIEATDVEVISDPSQDLPQIKYSGRQR